MLAITPVQRVPARPVAVSAPQRPFAAVRAALSDLQAMAGTVDNGPADESPPVPVRSAPPVRQARTVERPTIAID